MKDKQLLVNMIQCPDGTILESRHRYDFVEHTQEEGEKYFIDGGLSYRRVGSSNKKHIDLSCYVGDSHSVIRERFSWGSYGVDGKEPLHYILLKDLTEDHLKNLISYTNTVGGYPEFINQVFIDEKKYRESL